MLIKFSKWIDYGKSHPRSKKCPSKGAWSGSRDPCDPLKILPPFNISGMDEATLFKSGKWIDYGKSHCRVKRGEVPLKGA